MPNSSGLPRPSPDAHAHSERVVELVRARIRAAGGWLDFADYMDLVLYEPGFGYYSAGAAKFGRAGDFVTAPEISDLYAGCIGRACAGWLRRQPQRVVLELGAGTGRLAAGLLNALAAQGIPVHDYRVLEVSAELRERQRETLARLAPEHLGVVQWLDALPAQPLRGVVLANEVADALPMSRFVVRDSCLLAEGVCEAADGLAWAARAASPELQQAVAAIRRYTGADLPEGYRSEVNLRLPHWIAAVTGALGCGMFLLCDYGMSRREYYRPERHNGTLICHYRHRAHEDPFVYPGLQDISSWVDFTAVAEAADAVGLEVSGYSTQAHFLLDAGLTEELSLSGGQDAAGRARLADEARRLTLPGEMGEHFKVMALTRGEVELRGFDFRDLRYTL